MKLIEASSHVGLTASTGHQIRLSRGWGLIAVAAALCCLSAPGQAQTPTAPYQPFPPGYGYMEPKELAALERAWKQGDHRVVREHGWKLWAGIMQPAKGLDWPVWFTWPNTTQVFAPSSETGVTPPPVAAPATPAPNAAETPSPRPRGSLRALNLANVPPRIDFKYPPVYPIPEAVKKAYPNATTKCGAGAICDGKHFASNGDILIATESFSLEGKEWIRAPKQPLYLQSTLNTLHANKVSQVEAPQRHIVTKHMYWPVKGRGLTAIPVWHAPADMSYPGYMGYEMWKDLVAVDPSGKTPLGSQQPVSWLYGVSFHALPLGPFQAKATVHDINSFYHHKVTKADWAQFDEGDRAIIDAASWWLNNQAFVPGEDYLVTVAMHVNTKELKTWTMQSVWWTDQPNEGPYAANRPKIPNAVGPWQHYHLVDAYGIPAKKGGDQPVAMNPYIELVIHPMATNCNTCHNRAGWPNSGPAPTASYQNPGCPDNLATLTPQSSCLAGLTLTDFQWTIPDRALATAAHTK